MIRYTTWPGTWTPLSIYVPPYPPLVATEVLEAIVDQVAYIEEVYQLPKYTLKYTYPANNHLIQRAVQRVIKDHMRTVLCLGTKPTLEAVDFTKYIRVRNADANPSRAGMRSSSYHVWIKGPNPGMLTSMQGLTYGLSSGDNLYTKTESIKSISANLNWWHYLGEVKCVGGTPEYFCKPADSFQRKTTMAMLALLSKKLGPDMKFVEATFGNFVEFVFNKFDQWLGDEFEDLTYHYANGQRIRTFINKICKSMAITPHKYQGARYVHSYNPDLAFQFGFVRQMNMMSERITEPSFKLVEVHAAGGFEYTKEMWRRSIENSVAWVSNAIKNLNDIGETRIQRGHNETIFRETDTIEAVQDALEQTSKTRAIVKKIDKESKKFSSLMEIHADRQSTENGFGSVLWTKR